MTATQPTADERSANPTDAPEAVRPPRQNPFANFGAMVDAARGSAAQRLRSVHLAMTLPLPLRRRIAVVAVHPRVGASSLVAELTSLLTACRTEPVLAIDASSARPNALESVTAVRGGGLDTQPDVRSLDTRGGRASVSQWQQQFDAEQRRHELTITDWGSVPMPQVLEIASHSHVVCLAVPAQFGQFRFALDLARAISDRVPVIIAMTDVDSVAPPSVRAVARRAPTPTVYIPHDRRRVDQVDLPFRRRRAYSHALFALAAELVTAAGGRARRAEEDSR